MNIAQSGGYFNYPLEEQMKYFQSMPEYLLYDGLKTTHHIHIYGTESYLFDRFDIYHCHHLSHTLQFQALIKRNPLIVTLHNPFIASGFKPKLNLRIRYALRCADRIIALSEIERQHLINDYALDGKKIAVIPNGLKLELYNKPEMFLSKKKLGIPEDYKMILTIGQLLPYKNISTLITAFQKVRLYEPKTVLVIKTHTSDITNSCVDGVYIIGGKMTQRDLTDLYYSCDIYVQPSLAEALCTCITEAMLCARAVIATNVGGASTQISNGENGMLVSSSEKLYDSMLNLLQNKSLRISLGNKAQISASISFNQERMVKEHLQLYRSL